MKATEIIELLKSFANQGKDLSKGCDIVLSGDVEREVTKVVFTMFATPKIINDAVAAGAQMLVIHEPLYYEHTGRVMLPLPMVEKKRDLIERSGLVIYRFHDHSHYTYPDMICKGQIRALGFENVSEFVNGAFDLIRIELEEEMTPIELAAYVEEKLGIEHIKVCGATDAKCRSVSYMPGTPGGVFEELARAETEILMTGEACEWMLCEYARDAAELGEKKALLVLGHNASEREGMRYVRDCFATECPRVEAVYVECPDPFTYSK